MTNNSAQTSTIVAEAVTQPTPTQLKLGTDVSDVQTQQQESTENQAYEVLHGLLYTLEERESPADDGEDADNSINRINDGDDTWEKVMQLRRLLTLPSTSPDYQQPATVIKKIFAGSINSVFGHEILNNEKEIVLTCILLMTLCCGKVAIGTNWRLIALRLISLLPIHYIKFFLLGMELHLNNLDADILKALVERFKTDESFVNLLHQIFARQEMLKEESTPIEILSILSSQDDAVEYFGDELSKENKLPEKVQIVILNEMIAQINNNLNQRERARMIANMMNKDDDGEKINQKLSSGIDLNSHYVAKINELMRKLGIPDINTRQQGVKTIYKR